MVCTFFGHRDAPDSLAVEIRKTLIELLETGNVDVFYIGNSGNFDKLASRVLSELSSEYSFTCRIVLAYLPEHETDYNFETILRRAWSLYGKNISCTMRNALHYVHRNP